MLKGLGDGRKFVNTAKKVITERKKPIVVFKNGRTTRGAKQAASHTGSLGGTYSVVKGAFSQSGIISVDSYDELTASLKPYHGSQCQREIESQWLQMEPGQ